MRPEVQRGSGRTSKGGQGVTRTMSGQRRHVGVYVKQAPRVLSQNQTGREEGQVCQPGWYLSDKSVDRCVGRLFHSHSPLR